MLFSGSGFSSWAVQSNPTSSFLQLATSLNCSFEGLDKFHNHSYGTRYNKQFFNRRANLNKKNHKVFVKFGNNIFNQTKEEYFITRSSESQITSKPHQSVKFMNNELKTKSSNLKAFQCLREKSFESIVNVQLNWPKYRVGFGPIIDEKTILPSSLKKLTLQNCINYKRKKLKTYSKNSFDRYMTDQFRTKEAFGDIPLLLGNVATAGSDYLLKNDLEKPISNFRNIQVLRTFVRNNYRYHRQKIYDILAHNYYDWDRPNDSRASLKSLVDLITDGILSAPAVKLADMHSQCKPYTNTYFYSLGSTGLENRNEENSQNMGQSKNILKEFKESDYIFFGSPSNNETVFFPEGLSSEMAYFLGAPLVNGLDSFMKEFSPNQRMLSEYLLKYVFNFVKYGLVQTLFDKNFQIFFITTKCFRQKLTFKIFNFLFDCISAVLLNRQGLNQRVERLMSLRGRKKAVKAIKKLLR